MSEISEDLLFGFIAYTTFYIILESSPNYYVIKR